MTVRPFDPLGALATLVSHRVRFVMIGGFAARLHGSPSITNDLDVCYAKDDANLERLASAMMELGARLRGAPEGLPFKPDAATLKAGDSFTFETDVGALDILGTPSGTHGYDELERNAHRVDIDGMQILVASIEDLMRMKRAAGRPQDLKELEILGALREELERAPSPSDRSKPEASY